MISRLGSRWRFIATHKVQSRRHDNQHDHCRSQGERQIGTRKTRHEVAHESTACHEQTIGELRGDVFHVITPSPSRRENRGIGNWRAMVSKDRSCERGGKTHNDQVWINSDHNWHHDRQENPKGPPSGPRREREECRNQEDHGRQEHGPVCPTRGHQGLHKQGSLEQVTANARERPSEHQNDVGWEPQAPS